VTRLAVVADVHGNLPALEAVLRDIQHQDVDGIIGAGDYLTSGPFPGDVVRLLRSCDAWMIRGNAEGYFLDYRARTAPAAWYTSYQWAALRWSYGQLDGEILDFIARLPEQRVVYGDGAAPGGAPPIRIVHGSPRGPAERLFPDGDSVALGRFREAGLLPPEGDPPRLGRTLDQIDEPVLVCGHTHIAWAQRDGRRLALNPGAVSLSFSGDARARYALLTWEDGRWRVEHRAVPYDLDRLREGFRDSGFLGEGGPFARAALLNIETGRNVIGHLYWHIDGLAADAGLEDWDAVPDGVWERALATFDWEAYSDVAAP
jgi:predicted phosphodiesterase